MNELLPRRICRTCERPVSVCLCSHVQLVNNRTRVLILQHPRESWVPVNTARIAGLALANAERHVGIDFEAIARVRALIDGVEARPVLLSPGPTARDLALEPPTGPVLLVVVDGTWWQANKLVRNNPRLAGLPRYTLNPSAPSRYRIRREPAPHCMSTIEAIAQALAILEPDTPGIERLLEPFDAMVSQQLGFALRGRTRHVKRARRPRPQIPLVPADRGGDLVVGYGEANAWPRGTPLGDRPEIVHWVAERIATRERFEAFIIPRHPISPSFTFHTQIAAPRVLQGWTADEFRQRWAAFLRPSDLLGGWGWYASEILKHDGLEIPERVDVRRAAQNRLGRRPGEMLDCAGALGAPLEPPWAAGRAGQRLAAIAAVARALLTMSAGLVPE